MVKTRIRYAAGVGVLSTGILIAGMPAVAAADTGSGSNTAGDSTSTSSGSDTDTSAATNNDSSTDADAAAAAGTSTDADSTSEASAGSTSTESPETLAERAAEISTDIKQMRKAAATAAEQESTEAESDSAADAAAAAAQASADSTAAAAAPTAPPGSAEIVTPTDTTTSTTSGTKSTSTITSATASTTTQTSTSRDGAASSTTTTPAPTATVKATTVELAGVTASTEAAKAALASVLPLQIPGPPIRDVVTAVQTMLTSFAEPGYDNPNYNPGGGTTTGRLHTGAAMLLPAAATPVWAQTTSASAQSGVPTELTKRSGLLLEPSQTRGTESENLIQRLGDLVEGLGGASGSTGTPMDEASTLQKAITGVLVSVSLWALVLAALPGLSGLAVVSAAGVRIGYRQAKYGFLVGTGDSARFAGPGPLGVVRSESFIDLRSRSARKSRAASEPTVVALKRVS